ncbi:MAG: hypothetical protein JWO86_642 [Myxococcaceae bacterium]|nr:hypothetical protein [Myxococcaceae bacterium]
MMGLLGLVHLGVRIVIEDLLERRFQTDFGHPPWAAMTFLVETTQPYVVVGACLVACAALVPIDTNGEPRRLGWAGPASVVVSVVFELASYRYVEPLLETWGYRELTALELVLRGAANGLVLSALPVGLVLGASVLRRRAGSLVCAALGLLVAPLTLVTYRVDRDHRSLFIAFPLALLLAVGLPLAGVVANGIALARRSRAREHRSR